MAGNEDLSASLLHYSAAAVSPTEHQPQQQSSRDDTIMTMSSSTKPSSDEGSSSSSMRLGGQLSCFWKIMYGRFYNLIYDEEGAWPEIVLGFGTISLVGVIFGALIAPKDEDLTGSYKYVSACLGYTYTLAWSISFYPQVLNNYHRQSTEGLSVDFVVLNLVGFCCYGAFNAAFYYSETVQKAYEDRHDGHSNLVQSNDVAFAFHAIFICVVTLFQIIYYSLGRQRNQNPSPFVHFMIVSLLTVCVFYALLVVATEGTVGEPGCESLICTFLTWLDFLYMLSFIKLLITITKYIPQVVLNYNRQSTEGWSIWNILLDFMGGVLSTLQLILDCWNMDDWEGIVGDPAKFGLGFVSIIFDIIFFYQHYKLYSRNLTMERIPGPPAPSRYASIGTDDDDVIMIQSESAINSDSATD
mmetsp:Transcript_25614/g.38264  ORF Transcript_25614/g.38264 Transcript_25614/m.38264 type:complete len:413 (-) Transcript_25614:146-1384(-)|eukprot:CAMPEP_0116010704 /NCGR_PEP_ID=MMETSP0321-20121206/4146_1 /TAXON_ID=163516 /ORGANISM="Leptocylindrus danicus var. danicus, Strain B650" /LENGTH=412 /DNA_ID=CAMNT_0003479827 /DNA_START=259 /DNA_END=1497 /DNA_ORIENTATION=-